jgi:diguanylate cyclase (GGDEF)-like protein/PAS domain S-box-containing protein
MSRSLPPHEPISEHHIFDAVDRVMAAVREGTDIHDLLQITIDTVRSLLQTDRVVIYRFLPDQDAVVAAESIGSEFRPLLGELIYDPCFEHGWAEQYRQGHIGRVDDVQTSSLEPCYLDLLVRLQVRANLVVPVFCGSDLWGLLIAHHCQHSRNWQPLDLQFMQQMAHQLGQVAYQQQIRQQFQADRQAIELQLNQANQHLAEITGRLNHTNTHGSLESLFRLVTQHLEQFLFVRNAEDGQFFYVSPAYEKIWQRSCESLYQDPDSWLENVHPDDLSAVLESLTQQREGIPVIRDYRIFRPDGKLRWIHAQIYVICDSHQQPFQFVGWAEDCTERQQLTQSLQFTQERLNAILDSTIAAISYVRVYPDRRYVLDYLSAGSETVFGFPAEEFLADQSLWDRRLPADQYQDIMDEIFDRVFEENTTTVEYQFFHKDGSLRWIAESLISRWDEPEHCWRVTVLALDITAQKQAQLSLDRRVEQEKLLRAVTAHMRETLDLETILETTACDVRSHFQADRVLIVKNESDGTQRLIKQVHNPLVRHLSETSINADFIPHSHLEQFRQGRPVAIDDTQAETWPLAMAQFLQEFEVKAVMVAPIMQTLITSDEALWGLVVIHRCTHTCQWQPFEAEMLQHIAEQLAVALHQSDLYRQLQAANQELDRLSKTDALTLLSNRRQFDIYLNQEWQRQMRNQAPISLILADVDHFKLFNDTYGHGEGDRCLARIAQAMQEAIRRPADLGARYGGEEFAIVLPDTQAEGAIEVVSLIRRRLREIAIPHQTSPTGTVVTLSFGVATLVPQPGQRFETLIQRADQALYRAKEMGRDRFQVF